MGSSVGDYEVFLSFRGVDTHQGFISILYDLMTRVEIRVFKDDEKVPIGDKIDSILEAINTSKICIPIFSPRFAESKLCLNEVLRMVELKKTIIPIFYKVSPDDVKLKGESLYLDDFRKHEENHGNLEEVEKWKKALREATSNKGKSLGDKSYPDFCKELVDGVSFKLGPRKRLDFDYFVGDDNREAIIKLLEMESSSQEIVCVGIYGMGGIGKTTITKLIYNELCSKFEHCGFLPDIREFTKTKGVQDLPKYLLDNVEPKIGMSLSRSDQIPGIFKNKKVLLILDDVDSYDQIKKIARDPSWFGLGSRILLTTRDKKVVEDYIDESGYEIRQFEMKELEDGWALELFCKCAFGTDSPPSEFQKLSKRVVSYSRGLPLTITVTGKSLRNQRSEQVWIEFIERLQKSPLKEVKDKLMISYESLEDEQKTIFLDIACFFIYGQNRVFQRFDIANLVSMWQASYLLPHMSLQVLLSRSFLKIDEKGNIHMCNQLRDMGRDIVKNDNNGDIMKQSRLWEKKDIQEVLKCTKKKKRIEAICLQNNHYDNQYKFLGFENLRFLVLGTYSEGQKISGCLPKLVLLYLYGAFDVENLVLPNLVIFQNIWNNFQDKITPSFIQNSRNLKILNLEWCSNLSSIDPSIAELQHLTSLTLSGCHSLPKLPEELGSLGNLINLKLSMCTTLASLPKSFGKLQSLVELDLSEAGLTTLPESFGNLQSLVKLNLSKTGLTSLPESFGNLQSLVKLSLSFKRLTFLPESFGNLQSLVKLDLSKTGLISLPESFENLQSLVKLDLSFIRLTSLPKSFGNLQSLVELDLSKTAALTFLPESFGNLQSLVHLDLSEAAALASLPESFGNLQSLVKLDLSAAGLTSLPESFGKLQSLVELDLSFIRLTSLPESFGNLQSLVELNLSFIRLTSLPESFGNLQSLVKLDLSKTAALTFLPESFGNLQSLVHLDLSAAAALTSLPESFGNLQSLVKLDLSAAAALTSLPKSFGNLQSLVHLDLSKAVKLELSEACTHLVGMEDQEKEVMSGASKLVMDTHSVGMEGQVKEVMKLLDVECGGMFVVGIYGSGGVGKTTLAKAIFDQLSPYFQVCSFIRDIRENSKCKGIQYLQDELHSKILCTNKDDEVETMKDKFFNKKILIVLDDVDKKEQIKKLVGKFSWFGSGSRIIITTRNKSEIAIEHEGFGSSTKEWPKFEAFEMRQMEHDLALQLFNRHALGKDSCPNAYRIICNEIVEATGGFPLALEIVGSYLWHKTAEEWGSTLIMLKEACQQEIEETLKISYKALQYETQQIFLDIACFFCNKELSFPVYMWNACGYSPNQSIEALRLLSLIKIVDDNKLWMHDRVSDFGRKVVRENAMDPANRSRLWVHDEILYILEEKEESEKPTGKIEAIGVQGHDFPWSLSLSCKELEAMSNLRYLELCRFQFAGDANCSLPNLKWLTWNFCPPDFKAMNLQLEGLVILDLSRSRITHQWGGWAQIKMTNLEVLNLSGCKYLISTPNLSGYKELESLILEDCVSLTTIDSKIGELEKLKYLNLKGCISLSKLPEELFRAKKLEKILVSGNGQSFEVPELIGDLTRLSVLEIANVKTTAVPSDIGELKSLVRLDLSGADVTKLPDTFGSMMELLTVIKLDSSSIMCLPSSIGKLTSLEELSCRNCEDLQEIPVEIGELYSLRILDLSFTGISHLPETISKLSLLETLNLEPCNNLLELPHQLPQSLVRLSVVSKKLMNIPDLSVLKSVLHLKLTTRCESTSFDINWVGKLDQLKTLELCFPLISGLEFGAMTDLYSLCLSSQSLHGFSHLPSSLSRLFLSRLNVETIIPTLSRLKKLTFLELRGLSIKGWIGFAELESVEHLSVHDCQFNSLPTHLRALYINRCEFPDCVLDLKGLNQLTHLEIMDCKQLTHVQVVESLEEINISNCRSLKTVDDLSNLNQLEALKLDSCRKLRNVNGLDRVADSLKQFEIYNCYSLRKRRRDE